MSEENSDSGIYRRKQTKRETSKDLDWWYILMIIR